ncbi:hypothetical protein AB0F11_36770 [Streptomyces sp. NPDC032472]|uniref:hypothetical protein n=1 Tax=Streptomyces sp. NPDC032472 TaxID=3155018 RepID=UPI0033CE1A92
MSTHLSPRQQHCSGGGGARIAPPPPRIFGLLGLNVVGDVDVILLLDLVLEDLLGHLEHPPPANGFDDRTVDGRNIKQA